MPTSQPLASKDASLFKQVLKHYELKQYKKGLKVCEQILRKNPNHGETTAMKALLLASLHPPPTSDPTSSEPFTLCKSAVRLDMRSHVVWHIYGLLYRSCSLFPDAIRAYKMALRFEPESPQILRDLALLQAHTRDWKGYTETRGVMMRQRPGVRQGWNAVAVGEVMGGGWGKAERVLGKWEGIVEEQGGRYGKWDVENWEAALLKNRCIAEQGETERALEHLESIKGMALDKQAVMETRVGYLMKLGRLDDAIIEWKRLLERNPERRSYYAGLEEAMKITPSDRAEKMKAIYEDFAARFPRADAPRRIPLDFLSGSDFKSAADSYLRAKLTKGVPSTFANLKALYTDPAKRDTLFDLVIGYLELPECMENETFHLWTLYYLANHFNYRLSPRNTGKALEYIDKAIELSPKTLELVLTKARIYKHTGNLALAAETMDQARQLDKSDRYINTKTALYQLRADQNDKALQTMSLFTRNEPNGGPLGDLIEMQCVWYLTEDAESYLRQKKIGLALKRYSQLQKIFSDWVEDQFDFHSFSLRKGVLRAYIDMLAWEDRLKAHPFFVRAALGAIQTYLYLADHPSASGEPNFDAMTDAERKRYLKKQKRDLAKAEEARKLAEEKRKEERNKNGKKADDDDETKKKEDLDPLGVELAKTKTPLEEARKWVSQLLDLNASNIEVLVAAVEVDTRRGKFLLATQSLVKACKLEPENAEVHAAAVRLRKAVNDVLAKPEAEQGLDDATKKVLTEELEKIIPASADLKALNEEFYSKHSGSSAAARAVSRVKKLLGESPANDILIKALDVEGATLKDALAGLETVKEIGGDEAGYKAAAKAKWNEATAFAA